MAFDSKQFAWSNVEVFMMGKLLTAIRGVKYKAAQEKEHLHGRGSEPLSIQSGNKTYEGEITLLQSEVEALERAAGAGNDIFDLPGFDIVVTYVPKTGAGLTSDIIKGAELMESEKGMLQNDKFAEIAIPFMALKIEKVKE